MSIVFIRPTQINAVVNLQIYKDVQNALPQVTKCIADNLSGISSQAHSDAINPAQFLCSLLLPSAQFTCNVRYDYRRDSGSLSYVFIRFHTKRLQYHSSLSFSKQMGERT